MCFVGRLGKEKSLDTLITLFAENFKTDRTKKLFLIGDGPEREDLEALAQKLQADNIHFLGRIEHDDLPSYYLAFNMFATASLSEINSISMLEALASGLYIVQRDDKLNKNQITVGENGELFDTSEEFKEIINSYAILQEEQRSNLRAQVSASTDKYGIDEFGNSILKVYKKALIEFSKK